MDRRLRRHDRAEPPVPRLAGVLRAAAVPAVERALVLRRLGGDRRSLLLGRAPRGAGVGRAAALGTGPRLPGRAARARHAGAVAPGRRGRVGPADGDRRRAPRSGTFDPPPAPRRRAPPAPRPPVPAPPPL